MNTKVTTSKSQQVRETYESNRQFIQKVANLTDKQYCTVQYELGITFLSLEFPFKKGFVGYHRNHERNKLFWDWWKAEWKAYEHKLVDNYSKSDLKISKAIWFRRMHLLVYKNHSHDSFHHNYLKQTPVWETVKTT